MKNCSIRKFKRAYMMSGELAGRWIKREFDSSDKERAIGKKFDKATSRLFNLNYTYIEPEETPPTMLEYLKELHNK